METITEEKETYAICLQSLKHYNEGSLIFKWYNIEDINDISETYEEFKQFVKTETKENDLIEEIMVADYDNFPNSFGEYPDLDELNEFIEALNSEEIPKQAIINFYENFGQLEGYTDAYQGEYKTEEDFTYQLVEDCYNIDEMMGSLSNYFDYESFNKDLFMSDYTFLDGYVFSNNW